MHHQVTSAPSAASSVFELPVHGANAGHKCGGSVLAWSWRSVVFEAVVNRHGELKHSAQIVVTMDADVKEEEKPWVPDGTLPLAADGESMQMHLLDAHEEIGYPGTVYLFGKVRRLFDMVAQRCNV